MTTMTAHNINLDKNFNNLLFKYFKTQIRDFDYLRTRGWFCRNKPLQKKLFEVCIKGYGQQVFAISGDFDSHLDELMAKNGLVESDKSFDKLLFEYFGGQIRYFDAYLTSRGWFCRNKELQYKLFETCIMGQGSNVNAVAGDFSEHLDKLLAIVAEQHKMQRLQERYRRFSHQSGYSIMV